MDRHEEMLKEGIEILTVESLHRLVVFFVSLTLVDRLLDELSVIIALGETDDLSPDEDVTLTDGFCQGDTF